MAYGGSRVSNNDPEFLIADSTTIHESDPEELLCYYHRHEATIGALIYFTNVDPENLKLVSNMSDRLQYHMPSDDQELIEVIDFLSSNVGYYADMVSVLKTKDNVPINLEDLIENNPMIQALNDIKTESRHARTLRMWRSILTITYFSPESPELT